MRLPRLDAIDVLQFFGIVLMAISILAGRITLSRIAPFGNLVGNVEISYICLFGASVAAMASAIYRKSNFKFDYLPLAIIISLLIFLLFFLSIDLSMGREADYGLAAEVAQILLTLFVLYFLINNNESLNKFMIICIFIGLIVTIGDFISWRVDRTLFITGISASRINLFVIGLAGTMYMRTRQILWLLAMVLAVFTLLAGSMKIAVIGVSVAFTILVVTLIAAFRFADATKFIAVVIIGAVLSSVTGDINHTLSRIEVMNNTIPSDLFEDSILLGESVKKHPHSATLKLCENTANPTYCMRPMIQLSDTTERMRLFAHAISMIKTAPWVGLGSKAYKLDLIYFSGGTATLNTYYYPHNLILNIGVTHGIFGVSALLLLLLLCLVVMLSTFRVSFSTAGLLATAASVLAAAMTGGDFYDARYIFICAFLAALCSQWKLAHNDTPRHVA